MRHANRWLPLSLLMIGGCAQILYGDLEDYPWPVEDGGVGGSGGSKASSTSSSSSGLGGMAGMAGAGGGPVCTVAGDCPATANECITVECVQGACVETNVAADTASATQTAGDCKTSICDGNGAIVWTNDDTDTATDNKACTKDTCAAGMPAYPPESLGTTCAEASGKVCNATGACVDCNSAADCLSGVCQTNVCQAAACGDSVQNGSETDVDCGGSCGPCIDGKKCSMGPDCTSKVCTGMTCATPACNDSQANGTESDVDCGGDCVADCADGKICKVNGDCVNSFCNPMTKLCASPSCSDGFTNGTETDTDCGGLCPSNCANALNCMNDGDCNSGYCNAMMMCATPTCMDMAQNGGETDVDCGGATCQPCMNGQSCIFATDCSSAYCNAMMTCAAPTCLDMVKNGTESDVDCGGPMCPDCANGKSCFANNDCVSTYCNAMKKCAAATCSDGIQNGNETGIDCGGMCLKCNGASCTNSSECLSTVCYAGACVANVNGCTLGAAQDFTAMAATVTFANGNFTYAPKCIKVKAGAVITFNGNFVSHPLQGGIVSGGVEIPAASGPFIPLTNTGTTKNFTMSSTGTFPYYCQPHGTIGMNGAVFVVP